MISRFSKSWRISKNVALVVVAVGSVTAAILVSTLSLGFSPVLSNSMTPSFHAGEVVITQPEKRTQLRVGDVVILPLPDGSGQRYLHRIVQVLTKNGEVLVRTKGDNNPLPDPWTLRIDSSEVPKAVGSLPKIGMVSAYFRNTSIRLALSCIIFALVLAQLTRQLVVMRRRQSNKGRGLLSTDLTRHSE